MEKRLQLAHTPERSFPSGHRTGGSSSQDTTTVRLFEHVCGQLQLIDVEHRRSVEFFGGPLGLGGVFTPTTIIV